MASFPTEGRPAGRPVGDWWVMMARVRAFVALGANLGDARATLTAAVHALGAMPNTTLVAVSSLYVTTPVEVAEQPDFHNAAVALDVPAGPPGGSGAIALLLGLKSIERAFGRIQRARYGPRELDLDLLIFGEEWLSVERPPEGLSVDPAKASVKLLVVPHPKAHERLFVLAPLADIAPSLVPPGWNETVEAARVRRERLERPDAVRRVARWVDATGEWVYEVEEPGVGFSGR
jgi:2-amino-4-hydroxy-6-hydroxymethyldihydropteridine diphosphokinase